MRARRFADGAAGFLLALALSVMMLAALLEGCGTSSALMNVMFLKDAPADTTGVPESEYSAMADMITGYLAGETDEFQYTLTQDDGSQTVLFQEHEQQHMADCKSLFVLCRKVLLASAAASALLAALLICLKDARRSAKGCLIGGLTVLAAVLALCVWAAVDFSGLFVLFHRVSFSNSLWLLNPATDLLIRLMPTQFFVDYVILIAATWIAGLLLMLAVALIVMRRNEKRKK